MEYQCVQWGHMSEEEKAERDQTGIGSSYIDTGSVI